MKRFVIHIGPTKTGTTYLQTVLSGLRLQLREHGIYYCSCMGTPGHHELAARLIKPTAVEELRPQFTHWKNSKYHTILLSSEEFSSMRRDEIAAFAELVGDCPTQVIYYSRRWSDLVKSRWSEHVRHGHGTTLGAFCEEILAAPEEEPAINFRPRLHRWIKKFGPDSVRLCSLEAIAAAQLDLPQHFLRSFCGVDLPYEKPPPGGANKSLPLIETELLRALNAAHMARGNEPTSWVRRMFILANRGDRPKFQERAEIAKAAIAETMQEITFDETAPQMMALHHKINKAFRKNLAPPQLDGLLFTPHAATLTAPNPAWLEKPAARRAVEDIYANFAPKLVDPPLLRRQKAEPVFCGCRLATLVPPI